MTPEYLQFGSDIEAMERLMPLQGKRIVDFGCGDGALAFALAKRGASILGIESDPERARENRALGSFQQVMFVEGFAQNLPQNDGSVDCVVFSNQLRQIEAYDMDDCLTEACQVLKDSDGILYVLERETSGSYDDIMRMFLDESAERAWTLDALLQMQKNIFASVREIHYSLKRKFSGFDKFVAKFMTAENIQYGVEDVNNADVKALFEKSKKDAGYEFEQAMRIDLYRTGPVLPAGA